MSQLTRGRLSWLAGAGLAWWASGWGDASGLVGSRLDQPLRLTLLAQVGLLALGQQAVRATGSWDLSAGALLALSSVLCVGLGGGLGVGAALVVPVVAAVGCRWLAEWTRRPTWLTSALLLAPVAAALPGTAMHLAPEAVRRLACEPWGGRWPALLAVYGLLLAWASVRPPTRPGAAHALLGLCAGVVGLQTAGVAGAATTVSFTPVALGLGVALLAGADCVRGLLAAAACAAVLSRLDWAYAGVPDGAERAQALFGGALLAAGLWLGSTDSHEMDANPVGAAAAGVDEHELETALGAGRHGDE